MTIEDFCKWIESSNFKDGERLPSVREVAASSGASTFTVFRAYKKLAFQGKIYAEHGNGYFWGAKPKIEVSAHECETERVERLLLEDWKSGKISVNRPLPSICVSLMRRHWEPCGVHWNHCMQRELWNARGKVVIILSMPGWRFLRQKKFS